jgi:aerobic carbon-monoxide dehydrogenase large subunit
MNAPLDAGNPDLLKFGIGQPVPRREDPTLLRGEGRYSDDVHLDRQVHAQWCAARWHTA